MSVRALRILIPGTALLLALLAGCSPAASNLEVVEPWARAADIEAMPTPATVGQAADQSSATGHSMASGGAVSAAYMTIRNTGGAADRLIGATTPAAGVVEIHTVEMAGDVMRMRPLPDGLEIPAGGSVTLEPGGYHIMLMDLQERLVAGDTLALTLSFASGRQIAVQAEIRAP